MIDDFGVGVKQEASIQVQHVVMFSYRAWLLYSVKRHGLLDKRKNDSRESNRQCANSPAVARVSDLPSTFNMHLMWTSVGFAKVPFHATDLLTIAALFSTPGQAVHHRPHHSVLQSDETILVLLCVVVHSVFCFAPEHHLLSTPKKWVKMWNDHMTVIHFHRSS